MIDINEINKEIEKLEKCETSYKVCEKLAILYIVRDHYNPNKRNAEMPSSMASSPSAMMMPTAI